MCGIMTDAIGFTMALVALRSGTTVERGWVPLLQTCSATVAVVSAPAATDDGGVTRPRERERYTWCGASRRFLGGCARMLGTKVASLVNFARERGAHGGPSVRQVGAGGGTTREMEEGGPAPALSLFTPLEYAKAFDSLQEGVTFFKYSKKRECQEERVFNMRFHDKECNRPRALSFMNYPHVSPPPSPFPLLSLSLSITRVKKIIASRLTRRIAFFAYRSESPRSSLSSARWRGRDLGFE